MAFDAEPWILDGTTVDAEVIRRALGSLIGSAGGVVTPGDLTVTQNGTPNMSVNVGTGQIWVPGTSTSSQGPYYGRNGASVNVAIAAANATNPRIDTIAVQVEDPEYGGSGTPMAPISIKGTATSGANITPGSGGYLSGKAAVPASAYVVAYVLVSANATSIVTADILNVATALAVGTKQQQTIVRRANASGGNDYTFAGGVQDIDATNLNVTMNCRGVPVRVSFDANIGTQVAGGGGDNVPFNLRMDSTYAWGTSGSQYVDVYVPNNTFGAIFHTEYVFTPTAGSHVFAPQCGGNGSNTVVIYATATQPVVFQVEELD